MPYWRVTCHNDDCVCLVALLEGDLSEVEALRDVKADLLSKKEVRIISYLTSCLHKGGVVEQYYNSYFIL